MPVVDDLKKMRAGFPAITPNPEDLARLQKFFNHMKEIGIAKTREYDIPRPDTIGRALVNTRGNGT
jgi:hypothetical protein